MLSKVRFVDLAGSEKQHIIEDKELINEGSNINKSLLALTNCITILADDKRKDQDKFIPFRNSKLTRILKDTLNGNTPLVMVVNITTNSFFVEETINSLKYAEKAMVIKAQASNISCYRFKNLAKHEGMYKNKIKEMERQINYLKHMVANNSHTQNQLDTSCSNSSKDFSQTMSKELLSIKNSIHKLEEKIQDKTYLLDEAKVSQQIRDEDYYENL